MTRLKNSGPYVGVEFFGGVAMLCRDEGRTTEVLILTRSLSEALAGRSADHSEAFLAALWTVADRSEELLTAGRVRRPNTIH